MCVAEGSDFVREVTRWRMSGYGGLLTPRILDGGGGHGWQRLQGQRFVHRLFLRDAGTVFSIRQSRWFDIEFGSKNFVEHYDWRRRGDPSQISLETGICVWWDGGFKQIWRKEFNIFPEWSSMCSRPRQWDCWHVVQIFNDKASAQDFVCACFIMKGNICW
mgnify:CR=1 FL=1